MELKDLKFPTEEEISNATENELNNTYGTDWDDLTGIFENAVEWCKTIHKR